MEQTVFALAAELAGVTQGEAGGLSLCCRMAVEELTGRLKPGLTAEACGDGFVWAAAQLALADWWSLNGRTKRFTAGEVTVEEGQIDPAALRRQALRRLAGKLASSDVAVRGVRS